MTQDELARASGVGKATVVRAEGNNPVNALTAARIAKALSITLRQLETTEPEGS
jgi:DNA-binding XRE family transcriptional regulator